MLDFQQIDLPDINVILKSMNWCDPSLIVLMIGHLFITILIFLTRNRNNFQVILFMFLLMLVYCSEEINKIAIKNWSQFANVNVDPNGLFISLVFCVPILLNCMIMVGNWLYQSRVLMAEVKLAQLRARTAAKKEK